jgi:signal peptidase I
LQVGDRIIVSKISVELGTIHRGDIVVFKRPPAENCGGQEVNDLVKRVIGLPNEYLKSVGNVMYYSKSNNPFRWHVIHENWPHVEPLGQMAIPVGTHVPADSYYMIGDNHPLSCDSRYWGPVPKSLIVGKVILRIWPLSRFGFL